MTEITSFNPGGVTDGSKPVLAFPTDSAAGLGMVVDLARQGVTVSRSDTAFDSGGIHYPTGTALVDQTTLGSVDINAISLDRKVPVHGLDAYPTARHQLPTTKIGLYTGSTSVPTNPLQPGVGTGHCGQAGQPAGAAAYCEMLNVLGVQMKFPLSVIQPVTSTDLAAGNLISQNFTAFVNAGQTIAAGPGATALQAFVNNGGNYVGSLAGGTTTARNAGLTNLNTSPDDRRAVERPVPGAAGSRPGYLGRLVHGRVRHEQPGRLGLRHRRLPLSQRQQRPGLQPGDAGRDAPGTSGSPHHQRRDQVPRPADRVRLQL